MSKIIQIRYAGGSTSLQLPHWAQDGTRPAQRKMLKLMAEHATDCPENDSDAREFYAEIVDMIEDAKREAKARTNEAESKPDNAAAQAEARRANNSLKRLLDIKSDFKQAMEKYNPTRKFD